MAYRTLLRCERCGHEVTPDTFPAAVASPADLGCPNGCGGWRFLYMARPYSSDDASDDPDELNLAADPAPEPIKWREFI